MRFPTRTSRAWRPPSARDARRRGGRPRRARAPAGLTPPQPFPPRPPAPRPPPERARREAAGEPLAFGHSLEDQLGGQLDAGFVITALYEDRWPESPLG